MPRRQDRAWTTGSRGVGAGIGRRDIMIGLRELLLIGMVVLVLYGRTGVLKSRQAKTIMPWLSPVRRTTASRVGAGSPTAGAPRKTAADAASAAADTINSRRVTFLEFIDCHNLGVVHAGFLHWPGG